MKMEQLKSRHDTLRSATAGDEEKDALSKEGEKLREMLDHLRRQFGPPGFDKYGGRPGDSYGPPPGVFSSISSAHQIFFGVKDKVDEMGEFKRQRLDSLTELTNNSLKRSRTKSEAIQDISSSSINEYVERMLKEEFKVFDEEAEDVEEPKKESSKKKNDFASLDLIQEEDEGQIMQIDSKIPTSS